jgi:hypothetical protein
MYRYVDILIEFNDVSLMLEIDERIIILFTIEIIIIYKCARVWRDISHLVQLEIGGDTTIITPC